MGGFGDVAGAVRKMMVGVCWDVEGASGIWKVTVKGSAAVGHTEPCFKCVLNLALDPPPI